MFWLTIAVIVGVMILYSCLMNKKWRKSNIERMAEHQQVDSQQLHHFISVPDWNRTCIHLS